MPLIPGWSDDERERRARGLAALIRRVWRLIARQIAAQAERQDAVTLATARTIIPQWTAAIDDQIIGYVERMYLDAAGTVSDALEVPDSQLIGDDLVDHFTSEARNRLRGIGNDVWTDVQAQITLGNQSGESISEIAARIRNVTGVSEARSLTIARTEVHAAHEAGSHAQALFVDPNGEKVWLSTEDERTRPSHKRADGQAVKIGEPFTVGITKLRYPGDPLGDPGETINCRCSVAYNFDMITTVVDEPEPAMVAAGQQWKPHMHPRGNDGKFIEKGAVSDFLKKAKPNIVDVQKAVGGMTIGQWEKLTDTQKQYVKDSVNKLPEGSETHKKLKQGIGILEANAKPAAPAAPTKQSKPNLSQLLHDAKHGDVLATGTRGGKKFKITANKSWTSPAAAPDGMFELEIYNKDGSVGKKIKGDIFSISQTLHPLPGKGKAPVKVEWDAPGEADAPEVNAPDFAPNPPKPGPKPVTPTGTKIPAGLKGNPGDPAKITTGVVWGKHQPGDVILEGSPDFSDLRVVWNGKKYEVQSLNDIGDWEKQYDLSKKDFYANHKGDTSWVIPGGEKTHQPLDLNTPEMDQAFGDPNAPDVPAVPDEALGHDVTPDDVDWHVSQWERENAGQTTPEPPQTPSTPPVSATSAPDWTKAQDFSGFAKIGGQAGSNPGGKYKAPDGTEWYLKKPKSAQHAANEMAAAAFYNLAGVDAPQVMRGSGAPELGYPQTGTKIVPGAKANLGSKLHDQAYIKQLQSGFAMDAWLANWDVAGMGYDNVVEGADGKPHRIDVGGAMLYRAQGTPKGNAFGDKVDELTTLRDGTNPQAAAVFGSMTDEDIRKSAAKVEAISEAQIDQIVKDAGLPAGVAETLKARRKDILANYPPITETDELLDELLGPGTTPKPTTTPGSTIPGETLSLKQLHALIVGSKSKYTGGQVIATSPDGTKRITWSALDKDYVLENDNGTDKVITSITAIQTIRKENYAVPENLVPGGKGDIPPPAPSYDGPIGDYTQFVPTPADAPDVFTAPNKQMSLNDLKSGLLSLDEAVVLAPQLTLADYKALTHTERAKMEALTSAAKNLNMPNAADGYKAWTNLKHDYLYDKGLITEDEYHDLTGKSSDITYSPEGNAPPADLDVPDKDAMGIGTTNPGALYWLNTGDHAKMMTEDGKYKLTVVDSPMGKYALEQKQDDGTTITAFVNDASDVDYTVGTQVWFPAKKASAGKSHVDALDLMTRGKTNTMVSADGAHTLEKGNFTDFEVTTKSDDGGEDTYGFDTADQLEAHLGDGVTWFPENQQPTATNAPTTTTTNAPAAAPLDLDIVQEKIDLSEYDSGETIGVTKDGEHALLYNAILDGVVYKHKNGNSSTNPVDWDDVGVYDGDADTMDTAISQFVDENPDAELFDPADLPATSGATNEPDYSWVKTSGYYADGEIVATSRNDKFRMVKAGPNMYDILERQDDGTWSWIDGLEYEELNDKLPQLGDGVWKQKAGGIKHTTKLPAKKVAAKKLSPAKKAAPAGAVTSIYNSAHVTPTEKKFYLEDSEWGSLVPAEAVHLLSGSGGLDYNDWAGLTPTQSTNIEKMLHKAVDQGKPGAQDALDKWGDFAKVQQSTPLSGPVPGDGATLDKWLDIENQMFAGEINTGDILATSSDGNEQIVAWSPDGPSGNPEGFAHQTVGESGITTIKTYSVGYGGPAGMLNNDIGGKTWLDPNAQGAPNVTFDPPGTGAIPPSVVFNMLNFMDADDKAVLVGKDSDGGTWKMSVGLNADGAKVAKIASWHPNDKKFVPNAELSNEHEYNTWDDAGIKWDPPSAISNPEILNDTPNVTTPAAPELNPKNVDAIWDHVQTMNVKDVYAVSKNGEFRLSVAGGPPADKYLVVESKKADGSGWDFYTAPGTNKTKLMKHLNLHVGQGHDWQQPTKSDTTTVLPAGSTLTPNDAQKLWETAQKLDEDTVIATGKSKSGSDVQMVVKKYANGDSVITVQKKKAGGGWSFWYTNQNVQQTEDDLGDDTWSTDVDLPDVVSSTPAVSTPGADEIGQGVHAGQTVTAPAGQTVTAPAAAPAVPSVSTPPAPKLIPANKIYDLKSHLKGNGNLGYYSKPESIWKAVKEWQAKPGNDQYSPMDLFKSLDKMLKTTKPNPFQEKMTKWAASAKGIQTIGTDGIFGLTPAAPTPTSPTPSVPTAKSMPTISGDSANDLWSSMEAAPVGTVLANGQMNPYKYRMVSVIGNDGSKVLQIQFQNGTKWSPYETFLTKEKLDNHLKTQANVLSGGSYDWKPTLSAKTTGTPKAIVPDINTGNDISGISAAKQQDVYAKFKGQPGTFLSSSEGSIFDAFDAISKSEGLTLAQVINIVDELGAKKVNKPNAGLFKQKIATWLTTPQSVAHILNEPTVVTGLPTPPSFLPQYNPDTHLMSFDDSSKLTYDYVASNATATSYWNSIVAKSEPISPSQKKALTTWTGGTYTTVNTYLFKPNMPALSPTHKGVIKGAQEGMRPSDRPMVLVRGTGYDGLGNAANHAQLEKMVGQTWRNNAFAATSVGKSSHDQPGVHSPAFSHYPLWIEYECPPGTPMAWLAPFSSVGQGEREMLLAANLHYKIVSVEKKNVPGHGMKTIARVRIVPKPEGAA